MKASILKSPKTIEYAEVEQPTVGPDEVLVRIRSAGINRLDVLIYDGDLGVPYPRILGADVSGEVVESRSSRFSAGDRVLVNPGLPEDALAGWNKDRMCEYVRILGCHVDGGMAELISVKGDQVYLVPARLTFDEAASIPLDYLTAWRMLKTHADVSPGDSVLVWGASGSLGCAATAITRHLGGRPIAVGSRRPDETILKELGAEAWVDYNSVTFADDVNDLTFGRGVDVVFESVGSATWSRSIVAVRQAGSIVICGTTSGGQGTTDLEELYYKQITIRGSRMGYPGEFEGMLSALSEGDLGVPPIAARFRLADAEAAINYLKERQTPGKVILNPDE